jgi:uncharacterized protein YndB with AHSA1/START domain
VKRSLRIARTYPHPRELVWRALTERALIAEWLMENDFVAEAGARFTLRTDPGPGFDGIVHCEVLALDPPTRMRWSWRGGPIDTEVTFTLEEAVVFGTLGTRLVVEQTGFEGLPAVLVSFILDAGNRNIYGKILPRLLDTMARGAPPPSEPPPSKTRELWWWIARAVGPILRRRS